MIYSLALYLYALAVILIAPFHKKARLMVKGQWPDIPHIKAENPSY